MAKTPKSKEETEREEIEAQLMGGEVAEEQTAEEVQADQAELEPVETPETAPEEDLETVKGRLAKLESELESKELAIRQEREAKKQSERTLATLLDRLEAAQKEQQGRQDIPQEVIPDRNEDPAGFLAWQQEQTLREIRGLKEERQKESQLSQEERLQQTFIGEFQRQLNEYAAKTPDYNEAAQFLAEKRDKELQKLGIFDPQQRMQMLQKDALQIGAFAMQQGRNPAEIFYDLAKERGFQSKPQAGEPAETPKPVNQPKSLSNIGGKSPSNTESLQARADRILNTTRWDEVVGLDEKEFDRVLRQMG